MVRVLEGMQLKFLNRREWRDVAARIELPGAIPNIVEALRAGVRRLREPEMQTAAAEAPIR